MPEIAVVIPVRDGARTIGAQLEALTTATKPSRSFEVIVADNGSTDDTASVVTSFADRLPVHVVDAGHVPGINRSRNRGVAATDAAWLLFCDDDDVVDEKWLVAMEAAFEAGNDLIAGPIDYRRLNSPDVRAWRGANQASVALALGYLPSAHSSNLGITRSAFDKIGGWPEQFDRGASDTSFVWRAQLAGFELVEVPSAIVHYRLRQSIGALWVQSKNYGAGEVLLYSQFAKDGMRRRPLRALWLDLWWLLSRAPFAWTRGRRGAWVRRLGMRVGRVRGAITYRTLWW